MTRVTFGMYRKAAREPDTTLATAAGALTAPTPMPVATATITRHHRDGSSAAQAYMEHAYKQSRYWGRAGTAQAGWADAVRACYENYLALARDDRRRAFATGVNRELVLGADELALHIDVLLLDPEGYVPRLLLWDTNELTHALAVRYGAPAWRVMEDELGEGRVAHLEVWSLRQPIQMTVTPNEARAAMNDVAHIVQRLAS